MEESIPLDLNDLENSQPLNSDEAMNMWVKWINKFEPISDSNFSSYPQAPSVYGLFFPYSFLVRIRGRFDPYDRPIYPRSFYEGLIQSTILHEYTHLQHFSGTPAGIKQSIDLVIDLLNLETILPDILSDKAQKLKIPCSRYLHLNQCPGQISKWLKEMVHKNHSFFPSLDLNNSEKQKDQLIYPEDLSEVCAFYNQATYLNSRFSGGEESANVLKFFNLMKSKNLNQLYLSPKTSALWTDACKGGYLYLLPILVDLAFWGKFDEIKNRGNIFSRYSRLTEIAIEKYNGIDYQEIYDGAEKIWFDLLGLLIDSKSEAQTKSYYIEVDRETTTFVQKVNRILNIIPSSFFDTMTLGLVSRRSNFFRFIFSSFSYPMIEIVHDFPVMICPDNFPYPELYRKRSEGTIGMLIHPTWVSGEDSAKLMEWTKRAYVIYQIAFCGNQLICPERGVMALCGYEPYPKNNLSEHQCGFEYMLREYWGIEQSQIEFW